MKRGINPIAIIVLIVIAIAGLVAGLVVSNVLLPETIASRWGGLFTWGIFIIVTLAAGIPVMKAFGKSNKRR